MRDRLTGRLNGEPMGPFTPQVPTPIELPRFTRAPSERRPREQGWLLLVLNSEYRSLVSFRDQGPESAGVL
jgi:hypothetical protein